MRTTYIRRIPGSAKCGVLDTSPDPEWPLTYWINRINVPACARGQGHGTALLQTALEDADAEGITLRLTINPYGGLDYNTLRAWYERYGFTARYDQDEELFFQRNPEESDPDDA